MFKFIAVALAVEFVFFSPEPHAQGVFVRPACFHTPAWVQKIEGTNTSSTTTLTTNTFGSVGNANLIVCAFDYASGTTSITNVTDTKGNTWVRAAGPARQGGWSTYLYYAANVTGGTGLTVTYTLNSVNNNKIYTCHEYSGVATVSPLLFATQSTGTTSGSTLTVATGTASEGKQLAITYLGPITGLPSSGAGWTMRSNNFNNIFQDRRTTAAGTTYPGTVSLASGNSWYGTYALFQCRP